MSKNEFKLYDKNMKEREDLIIEKNIEMLTKYDKIVNDEGIELPDIRKVIRLKEILETFMNFKYPDRFLYWAKDLSARKTKEFYHFKKSFNSLDMNELKFRLDDDMLSLIDCKYPNSVPIKNVSTGEVYDICLNNNADVATEGLNVLKTLGIISSNKEKETIDELEVDLEETLGLNSESDVYTSDGVKILKYINNEKQELRQKVFEVVALDLLYNHNTSLENGYYRAISFLRMVNKEYKLDINLEKIFNPNYLETKKNMIKF